METILTSLLTILYGTAATITFYLAFDFYCSKDGYLRKLLIFLFLVLGVRYMLYFLANILLLSFVSRLVIGVIIVPVETTALILLHGYIRWKR